MAYVVHPTQQIGFPTAPVNHSPSPLTFGFGLSSSSSSVWQAQHQIQNVPFPSQFSSQQKAAGKRRHDETEDDTRDQSMDRSPTPENKAARRIVQKKIRTSSTLSPHEEGDGRGGKGSSVTDEVDIGMLLASLPPQSLLPLLNSLLSAYPSLKPVLLEMIPRPTLETALSALTQSARKLRSAYPYSSSESVFSSFSGTSFQGRGRVSIKSEASTSVSGVDNPPSFPREFSQAGQTNMRDSYVLSRLRPHINDFVSTAFSYLSYFSTIPSSSKHTQSQADKKKAISHPNETFQYLSALTGHFLSQPPLAQSALSPSLLPRLLLEWKAWINRIDAYVNNDGGMFGMEVVRSWESALDGFAAAKVEAENTEMRNGFKQIRDDWVDRLGWLIGRRRIREDEKSIQP